VSITTQAMIFARTVHRDQRRKYTGNPYADHLAEVAGIVATVAVETIHHQAAMVAAAWLHDCIEDQGVTVQTLEEKFGQKVAHAVLALSDLEEGNRAARKAASRARLAAAPWWVQAVKVADLISNTDSIVQHDPTFARVYLEEKRLLLDALQFADHRLVEMARDQIRRAWAALEAQQA
jgi:GTP diphosphokinase / guanosine-3',5'-bis(diphosphate) 3'-diphosphatase